MPKCSLATLLTAQDSYFGVHYNAFRLLFSEVTISFRQFAYFCFVTVMGPKRLHLHDCTPYGCTTPSPSPCLHLLQLHPLQLHPSQLNPLQLHPGISQTLRTCHGLTGLASRSTFLFPTTCGVGSCFKRDTRPTPTSSSSTSLHLPFDCMYHSTASTPRLHVHSYACTTRMHVSFKCGNLRILALEMHFLWNSSHFGHSIGVHNLRSRSRESKNRPEAPSRHFGDPYGVFRSFFLENSYFVSTICLLLPCDADSSKMTPLKSSTTPE